MSRMLRTSLAAALAALTSLAGACSSGSGSGEDPAEVLAAHVASYDLAASGPQRFLLGITTTEQSLIVGGTIELAFRPLGDQPSEDGTLSEPVTATFLPLGDEPPAARDEPHEADVGETSGAYEATGVTFSEAGTWEVQASIDIDGEQLSTTSAFEVVPAHEVPAVGEPAPRSTQPLAGDTGVAPTSIDSRAADGVIPDPMLHGITIEDAVAAGRPTVVVVSTPVYCLSRFCGPITDVVDRLAAEHGPRASFAHLEVWQDYERSQLNPAAGEWIVTSEGGNEPWVFLLDAEGTVVRRWDNVTNGADLEAALTELLARPGR